MKNTLTKTQLLEAQNAFKCEDWKENIQEILDSTNEEIIEIKDEYLDLIKEEATLEEIEYCKALNLDLKMNLPEGAKEFILKKINGCEVIKFDEFTILCQENGKNIFVLNSKYKELWFSYEIFEIEKVLRKKYSLKFNEIMELMNTLLEEHFKLMVIHQSFKAIETPVIRK